MAAYRDRGARHERREHHWIREVLSRRQAEGAVVDFISFIRESLTAWITFFLCLQMQRLMEHGMLRGSMAALESSSSWLLSSIMNSTVTRRRPSHPATAEV